ncbi:hypothetical protein K0M31_003485 [Melipona bicolor]|uniref:Uncharacterized protein n=1 Tax=Melipona bicolor TaxID=60889 RepID=A0AA40KPK6_9HYME|nr:hypothetical protein K0M31_003485 [Melipona bicolor]
MTSRQSRKIHRSGCCPPSPKAGIARESFEYERVASCANGANPAAQDGRTGIYERMELVSSGEVSCGDPRRCTSKTIRGLEDPPERRSLSKIERARWEGGIAANSLTKGRRRRPRNSGRHNERFHASPRRGVAPPLELLIKHTN